MDGLIAGQKRQWSGGGEGKEWSRELEMRTSTASLSLMLTALDDGQRDWNEVSKAPKSSTGQGFGENTYEKFQQLSEWLFGPHLDHYGYENVKCG